MNNLTVDEAVRKILTFYNNTGLFTTSLRTPFSRPQFSFLNSEIAIDIHNEKYYNEKGITLPLPNLEYAYQVLSKLTKLSIEECKEQAKILFKDGRTNVNKEMYMTAFLIAE